MTTENEHIEQEDPTPVDAAAIGRALVEERERQTLTRADVAEDLKLHIKQIEAMEEGRFEDLPTRYFARGFLRNYSRRLGIEDKIVPMMDEVIPNLSLKELKQNLITENRGAERREFDPFWFKLVLAVVLLGLAIFGIVMWQNKSNELNKDQVASTKQIADPVESMPTIDNDNIIVVPIGDEYGDNHTAGVPGSDDLKAATEGKAADAKAKADQAAADGDGQKTPGADLKPDDPGVLVLKVKAGAKVTISNSKGRLLVNGDRPQEDKTYTVGDAPPYVISIFGSDGATMSYEGEEVDLKSSSWKGNTYLKYPK